MISPSNKQIEYAKIISEYYGVPLPKDNTKNAYCVWLNYYVPKYKKEISEMNLLHELNMESIDARRDW